MYPNPIRTENHENQQIAIFSKTQIDYFGDPPFDLYPSYLVVETQQDQPDYVQGFEEITHCELRKKHRYVRYSRFKRTLFNLLGDSNFKPKKYDVELLMLKTYLKADIKKPLYDQAKDILKHFNQPHLYRHIPTILNYLGYKNQVAVSTTVSNTIVQKVLEQFQIINQRFDMQQDKRCGRRYFPNLKFIAAKLLKKHNVIIPINFIRTKRKLESLEFDFNILINFS